MKGSYRRNTTSLYLIESREAERKLAEARNKKKAENIRLSQKPGTSNTAPSAQNSQAVSRN
jgi:hypothetical protein